VEFRSDFFTEKSELSMGWVDRRAGLGWVGLGQDFSVFDGFGRLCQKQKYYISMEGTMNLPINKKVSKADKSRTLLPYSVTCYRLSSFCQTCGANSYCLHW